ncbi:uncharacterized protein LOC123532968 isoform X2 [Mercenaria mercenaria]|nr:uncharacterized protein LOC123532968 isoform X2 [Mercenaria mercenaria]
MTQSPFGTMSSNCETAVCINGENDALLSEEVTNNKDDTLDKLYVNQCLFSIPKEQVRCIQYAVEIMINFLLTIIYENTLFSELVGSNKIVKRTLSFFKTKPSIHYAFSDRNLLKVGSFYEGTKNHYPDEFDFICVIADCSVNEYELMKAITAEMSDIFHLCLRDAVLNLFPMGTCIEFVRYVRLHGPASRLEFNYEHNNASSRKRSIFVDISPAVKVYTQNELPTEINVQYSDWKSIILATGSFLLLKVFSAGHPKHETKTKISITESEQYYVLMKMSEKHKKVYRLLKYILDNESIGEELRELIRSEENQISVVCCRVFYPRVVYEFPSYVIKTFMFHHCHHCNQRPDTIQSCFVSVLNSILKLIKTEQKYKVLCFWRKDRSFSVSVKTMTGEMIEIADSYDSSLKIKKYLKEIRKEIGNDSQADIIRNTEPTPLARKMVNVFQTHREKRKRRKACIRTTACVAVLCSFFILVIAFGYISFLSSSNDVEMRWCWNGTGYSEGINYTSNGDFNLPNLSRLNLSSIQSSVQRESVTGIPMSYLYCLEYEDTEVQEDLGTVSWANVSRIYYCGDKKTCNKDKLLYSKINNNSFAQEHICHTHDYESGFGSKMFNSSDRHSSQNEKQLTCWRTKTCLDMVERHYRFAGLLYEYKKRCTEHQSCLPAFFRNAKQLSCYESKHFQESATTTDTEICCCDRSHCTDPELDETSKLLGHILGIMYVVGVIIISLLCICGKLCLCLKCAICKHHGKGDQASLTFYAKRYEKRFSKMQRKRISSLIKYTKKQ